MMKRMLLVVLMLLLGAIVMVGCVDSNETTESSPSPEANITPSTTTAEQVYYFQTADNFVELDSGVRGPSFFFRHDRESFGETGEPNVRITATIPSSIEINGVTYNLNTTPIKQSGRDVYLKIQGVSGVSSNLTPQISIDAVTGKLLGIHNVNFYKLSASEKEMQPVDLAKQLIADFLPDIPLEEYELWSETVSDPLYGNGSYDTAVFSTVKFKSKTQGYSTEKELNVVFFNGYVCRVTAYNPYLYEDLDLSSLERINKDETEKIILSLIDYVRNGNKIKEPKLFDKSIVLMSDGRYAIRYDIDIQLDDPEQPWEDRISACIYLDDSKAE